jgi:hypothetical protein
VNKKTPFFRYNVTTKTNRRYIESKLDNKWYNIAKITIFNIQRGYQETKTKRCHKGYDNKNRKSKHMPTGLKLYQSISKRRMAKDIKKSIRLTITALAGITKRGK